MTEPTKLEQIRDLLAAYRDLEKADITAKQREKFEKILDAYAEAI